MAAGAVSQLASPPAAAPASRPAAAPAPSEALTPALERLWAWMQTWITPEGAVHGPVIHRCDLKRMFAIHDTPWTQGPTIEALLHLHRASGRRQWLDEALRLAGAQARRQQRDGRFRWAGHEDDRYSSLVHNALADVALLKAAEAARDAGQVGVCDRMIDAARRNVDGYLIGRLWDEALDGFRMNTPLAGEPGAARFVVNMNSVAVEAMLLLDRLTGGDRYGDRAARIGRRILSLQARQGPQAGALAYSHTQPDCHITLYTALAMRGLGPLARRTGDDAFVRCAADAAAHVETMRDPTTGLWFHMVDGGRLHRYPLFVAGAGMIANGLLDAAALTGQPVDADAMAAAIVARQGPHGGIRNFIGYDHADNLRRTGRLTPRAVWEDVVPTPNWNAQALLLLARVAAPPSGEVRPAGPRHARHATRRMLVLEGPRRLFVLGLWPPRSMTLALWRKTRRHGLALRLQRLIAAVKAPLRRLRTGGRP